MELTFHTSAAPTREQGCEQSALGWVQRSSSREVAMRVVFFFLSFSEHRFSKSASPMCILTLKWGLLHLQGEKVRREVNGGGLSLVVPHQEAPQLSGTSSDD